MTKEEKKRVMDTVLRNTIVDLQNHGKKRAEPIITTLSPDEPGARELRLRHLRDRSDADPAFRLSDEQRQFLASFGDIVAPDTPEDEASQIVDAWWVLGVDRGRAAL